MTEKIQLILEEIKLKCKNLHSQLEFERSKNLELKAELDAISIENSHLKERNEEFTQTNLKLVTELEATIKQGVEVHNDADGNRNAEIDELVREIEYCITQLKK
jgi:response regulator RpfG family c-di-GMP phosphodiesterase